MEFIFVLIFLIAGFLGFNWLMGYRNRNITLDLDDRFLNLKEYVEAVKEELEKQGKDVEYKGNRLFIVDGKKRGSSSKLVTTSFYYFVYSSRKKLYWYISRCSPLKNSCFLKIPSK